MFQKLKDKLKKTLSIFSRKVEAEAKTETEQAKAEIPKEIKEKSTKLPSAKPEKKKIASEKTKPEVAPAKETKEKELEKPVAEPKKGFFERTKELITTKKLSQQKFDELFFELELVLLENNVAVEVIDKIKADLSAKLVDKSLPRNLSKAISDTLKETISEIIWDNKDDLIYLSKSKKPYVIAFFGINGSGKTTTIAKVAYLLQKNGLTVVMAAGDTFRAAAIQQLEEHADKLGIKVIKHDYGADAAAVSFDAVKYAEKSKIDVVLIDTAGRLHSDVNLMDELKKIVRVAKPDLKLFVGESITGNDCIEQANKFNEMIGIDAIILTKADVDEKGGTALSISYVTKKPIIYIGTGQKYEDFAKFTPDVVLNNLGLD